MSNTNITTFYSNFMRGVKDLTFGQLFIAFGLVLMLPANSYFLNNPEIVAYQFQEPLKVLLTVLIVMQFIAGGIVVQALASLGARLNRLDDLQAQVDQL
jgi:hypothetical protein